MKSTYEKYEFLVNHNITAPDHHSGPFAFFQSEPLTATDLSNRAQVGAPGLGDRPCIAILKGLRPILDKSMHGSPNECGKGNGSCSLSKPAPSFMDIGAGSEVGKLGTVVKGQVIG